jgi:hypothetical protein
MAHLAFLPLVHEATINHSHTTPHHHTTTLKNLVLSPQFQDAAGCVEPEPALQVCWLPLVKPAILTCMRDFGVVPDETLSIVDAARNRLYVERVLLGTKTVTGTDSSRPISADEILTKLLQIIGITLSIQ